MLRKCNEYLGLYGYLYYVQYIILITHFSLFEFQYSAVIYYCYINCYYNLFITIHSEECISVSEVLGLIMCSFLIAER